MIRSTCLALGIALAAAPLPAADIAPNITAAVADMSRPAEDRARDATRKPAELLAFAGVKPGMTVVELFPGGGYFTRLFSDAVGPGGKVVAYVPDEFLARYSNALDKATAIARDPAHANVTPEHNALMAPGGAGTADMVWTSQNYHDIHDLPGADLVAFNRLVYRALRPGGVYVVIDHAAAAGSGAANTNDLHRIDPALVRKEAEAAGFRFDGQSNALANPADPHTAKVFDPAIRGRTDQFAYRFRKPG